MSEQGPFRCALTPELPECQLWDVQVVRLADRSYATVFSVGTQHFTIVEGNRTHCRFIRRMFLKALARIGLKRPRRP